MFLSTTFYYEKDKSLNSWYQYHDDPKVRSLETYPFNLEPETVNTGKNLTSDLKPKTEQNKRYLYNVTLWAFVQPLLRWKRNTYYIF